MSPGKKLVSQGTRGKDIMVQERTASGRSHALPTPSTPDQPAQRLRASSLQSSDQCWTWTEDIIHQKTQEFTRRETKD